MRNSERDSRLAAWPRSGVCIRSVHVRLELRQWLVQVRPKLNLALEYPETHGGEASGGCWLRLRGGNRAVECARHVVHAAHIQASSRRRTPAIAVPANARVPPNPCDTFISMSKLLSVSLPDELSDGTDELAAAQGRTRSDVVRDALRSYLWRERWAMATREVRANAEA